MKPLPSAILVSLCSLAGCSSEQTKQPTKTTEVRAERRQAGGLTVVRAEPTPAQLKGAIEADRGALNTAKDELAKHIERRDKAREELARGVDRSRKAPMDYLERMIRRKERLIAALEQEIATLEGTTPREQAAAAPDASFKSFMTGELLRLKKNNAYLVIPPTFEMLLRKIAEPESQTTADCVLHLEFPYETEDFAIVNLLQVDLSYEYRDGKWVLKSGNSTITDVRLVRDNARMIGKKFMERKGTKSSLKSLDDFTLLF